MSKTHKLRIYKVLKIAITMFAIVGLTLYALQDNIQLYLTPSEWYAKPTSKTFKLGGLVKSGSLLNQDHAISFKITDGKKSIEVSYMGVLPSLFQENKGVIVEGEIRNKIFYAKTVLAKHDENYRPPNIKAKV